MARVFHLIKSLGRGGAEMLLAEGLRFSQGDRFEYGYGYFLPWKSALVPSLKEQGAEVVCFEAKNNLAVLLAARRVALHLQHWKADLLHCHLPLAGIVGRIAAKMARIPVVYTEHNRMERYHPITRRVNLLTWSWQNRVIAVSNEVATSIFAHANGTTTPVEVVLNGVDTERFSPAEVDGAAIRQSLNIPASAPVVGTVAVFRIQKRLDHWLEAARRVRDRHHETRFLLVGDGPLNEELRIRSLELGLGDAVHFVGLQEDVRPYLAAMDIYMMSSLFEGLPVALLEAMAMRCGIVATRVGGIPEIIRDGENGLLVEPLQPDALSAAASQLLDCPDMRHRMGNRARGEVEARLGMRRMTREIEDLYARVLRNGRNG